MRLHQITLKNFRNIASQTLTFSNRKNIFIGKNGQGKTNLLESLYYLSHSRSNRTNNERELIRSCENAAFVKAEILPHRYEGRVLLETQWRLETAESGSSRLKTLFKVNNLTVRSRSQILGYLPTVSFFISDLLLLRGTPEDRRRWLDAAIIQYDKRYFTILSDFQRIKHQKSRLLKDALTQGCLDFAHLESWNSQFAAIGAKVIANRLFYLYQIQPLAILQYWEMCGGRESLSMVYHQPYSQDLRAEVAPPEPISIGLQPVESEIESQLQEALQRMQKEEIRRGTCLIGPHRDDILFSLSGLDAHAYGSQGQQRTVVLAIKLSELQLLNQKLDEPPVLMLDDVMAELDPDRQQLLVESLNPESQVFLTTTHLDGAIHPFLDQAAIYTVDGGVFTHEAQADFPIIQK